MPDNFYLHVA